MLHTIQIKNVQNYIVKNVTTYVVRKVIYNKHLNSQ